MSQSFDVVAYDYNADRYCGGCTTSIASDKCFELDEGLQFVHDVNALSLWAKKAGIDQYDESSYDSDDYPKVVFRDMLEDEDERCSKCDALLD